MRRRCLGLVSAGTIALMLLLCLGTVPAFAAEEGLIVWEQTVPTVLLGLIVAAGFLASVALILDPRDRNP